MTHRRIDPAPGLALVVALALALAGCGDPAPTSRQPSLTPPTRTCSAAGVAASEASALATACLLTSQGELVVELDPAGAPATVANFLSYVEDGFYDQTVFHRVIAGFVVQGGGVAIDAAYRLTWKAPTHPAIALESAGGLKHLRGTIAMARLADPAFDSATSQFFVNLVDNPSLDHDPALAAPNGYAAFGRVISGMETADRIAALPTNADQLPFPVVVLYWARRLK